MGPATVTFSSVGELRRGVGRSGKCRKECVSKQYYINSYGNAHTAQ